MTRDKWVKEVKKALIDKDMSMTDLASKLKCSTMWVYMTLKGQTSKEMEQKICDALNIER